jgi:putative membrane protein
MNSWLLAGVCALAIGTSAAAQTSSQKPTTPSTDKAQSSQREASSADAAFVREAAMSSMAEVEHGRAAVANASHDEVKKFGQRMIDDHSKAVEALKGIASQDNVTLPAELDLKHRAMQQKLEKMKGEQFDRAYMQHMVQAHQQAVTLFQREAKSGKDAETRAWAEKTLPTVQEHLKMATALSAKLGKGTTK